jgi:sugar phosphate isomerase/epimerase
MQASPELTRFLNALDGYGYTGPITLELAHNTPTEEIAKTKAFFEKTLQKYQHPDIK